MRRIPLFRSAVSFEAADAVRDVLNSGWLGQGPVVEQFEVALQKELGSFHRPITLNSGTAALELALELAGVGPGSVVVSTPITFAATNTAIVRRGALIAWADINLDTGLIDPESVCRVASIYDRARVVMAVDWGGRLCDFDALVDAAPGAIIVEDAAQAWGAPGRSWGQGACLTCLSFQAIKSLPCGDGGALVINGVWKAGDAMQPRAKLLRYFGLDRESTEPPWTRTIDEAGGKLHLNDIHAAIGLANLDLSRDVVKTQRENAAAYHEELRDVSPNIIVPPPTDASSWWLYPLRVLQGRDGLLTYLAERGIEASPVHRRNDEHPALRRACVNLGTPLPNTAAYAAQVLCLPCGWWVGQEERADVVAAIRCWATK